MESPEQRQVSPEEGWLITCHEAAHAVVGVYRRIVFTHVERGEGEHGEVSVGVGPVEAPEETWSDSEIASWQLFYAAGAAGEKLLFGCYRDWGARQDRRNHEFLEKMRSSVRAYAWDQDVQTAVTILNREPLEMVARELERQRTLTDVQVYEILGRIPEW